MVFRGNPQYGPPDTAPQEIKALWFSALRQTRKDFPLSDSRLLAEALRLKMSPDETQLMIAHADWLIKRQGVIERFEKEEQQETPLPSPPRRSMKPPTTVEEVETQADDVQDLIDDWQERLDDMENPDTRAGEALEDRIERAEEYKDAIENLDFEEVSGG